MNPIEAVTSVLRNYAKFSGRAQRSEFLWLFLFTVALLLVIGYTLDLRGIGWIIAACITCAVMVLILSFPGTRGPNRYGSDPLEPAAA